MAAPGADRVVRLWNVERRRKGRGLPADAATEAASLAWSADGKLLAVGRADLTVQVWDMAAPERLLKLLPAPSPPDKEHPACRARVGLGGEGADAGRDRSRRR